MRRLRRERQLGRAKQTGVGMGEGQRLGKGGGERVHACSRAGWANQRAAGKKKGDKSARVRACRLDSTSSDRCAGQQLRAGLLPAARAQTAWRQVRAHHGAPKAALGAAFHAKRPE